MRNTVGAGAMSLMYTGINTMADTTTYMIQYNNWFGAPVNASPYTPPHCFRPSCLLKSCGAAAQPARRLGRKKAKAQASAAKEQDQKTDCRIQAETMHMWHNPGAASSAASSCQFGRTITSPPLLRSFHTPHLHM